MAVCAQCGKTHKPTGRSAEFACKGHHGPNHTEPGSPCTNQHMNGQEVCRAHGGKARQNVAAAAKREVLAKAEGLLSQYGEIEATSDPLGQLLRIHARFDRLATMLEAKVDELSSIRYQGIQGEQLRAEISAYTTVLDRCRQVLVDILRLDIEERLARVEERQVAMFEAALDRAMADAGVPDKAREVKSHVARHLRIAAS